jgi:Type IV secretion system pilin
MWKVYTVAVLALFPILFVAAAGLVPCGGSGEPLCQTCHVVALISNVSDWLVLLLGIVAAIIIVVSGLQIVMSVGNTGAVTQARRRIYSMLIGYVILLSGWLLLDLGLKMLLSDAAYGTWNVIQCTVQPQAIPYSRQTASGDSATVLPPAAVSGRVAAITSSGSLQTDIANAAAAAGITDQAQVNKLRALISQESSNCTNKVGPATDYGTAYGCGQMLVGTARSLDPALSGLSDTEVANKLRDDNAYNLTLSAKYYKQLLSTYGNSTDLALAA